TARSVMPQYFQTMHIPIKLGREFSAADNTPEAPPRFVVNETFVKRYFAGEQPLGKTIRVTMQSENPFGEIIGVLGDVKEGSVDGDAPPPASYTKAPWGNRGGVFGARPGGERLSFTEPARRIVHSLDAAQPVADIRTMDAIVRETFSRQSFSAVLMITFSAV